MNTLHVLHGTKNADRDTLIEAARTHQPIKPSRRGLGWLVPKGARPGDDALVFVSAHFFALARILDEPIRQENGSFYGNAVGYRAGLSNVRLIKPIPISTVKKEIPKWGWLRYPRGKTTPPPEIAARLLSLVQKADAADKLIAPIKSGRRERYSSEAKRVAIACAQAARA
jgi:hypothetical protein